MPIREITLGLLAALTVPALADVPSWKAMLIPKSGSRLTGSVTVESVGSDSIRTTIQVSGGAPGKAVAWHINRGACGSTGEVLGAATSYPQITLSPDGRGTLTSTLAVAPPSSGEYSVTVQSSPTDPSPVACGALRPVPGTPTADSMANHRMDSMPPMKDSATRQ